MGRFSRFVKKFTKPVAKVFDKIIPNEIKPALPYLAAFAPMLLPQAGIMSSMLGRGLMSGGLNIGAQLAQEGNEGDINALSALIAGGLGSLSAQGAGDTLRGGTMAQDPSMLTREGVMSQMSNAPMGANSLDAAQPFLSRTGDSALNFLAKGADKLSAINTAGAADPFSKAGLKAAVLPFSQATADLAYADAQRALKDYENSQGEDSGYSLGDDTNRGLAVRRAMERGGHEEQTIRDTLESLQYPDPDPQELEQELAYGGRVNAMGGGVMSNQRGLINQPGGYAGKLTREDIVQAYEDSEETENLLNEMIKNGKIDTEDYKIVKQNILSIESISNKNYDDYENKEELKQAQEDLSNWTKRINQLDEKFKQDFNMKANGGRINFAGGGMDAGGSDFGGIPRALENVETAKIEEVSEIVEPSELSKLDGFAEMLSEIDNSDPKYTPLRNMAIEEATLIGEKYQISPGNLVQYVDSQKNNFMEQKKQMELKEVDDGKKEILMENLKNTSFAFANGGVTSVLPQGMEMDYRGGGFIPMGSKERADDVPARVSKNEFVMTADAVRAAGGGSVNKGAKRMYEMMNNLEARV